MGRVAVLGSNSFAGAGFVDAALRHGHDVLGISRSPEGQAFFLPYKANARADAYSFARLDLNRDREEIEGRLEEFRPEFIVDFAAQSMVAESWRHPEQWYQTNIVSKVRLHDFLRARTWLNRYVRVSTPEVYGSTPEPVGEDHAFAPSTPYAVSQAATDMSLLAFHRQYGFPVVITRFANFFGAGQQLYRIVPRTVLSALSGSKLPLHGDGSSVRAFIHVRDVADGILATFEHGEAGQTYHFSPSHFHTIRQVVEAVCAELRVPYDQVVEPAPERPGKDHAYLMKADKARARLGWEARVPFVDGIRETILWAKEHLEEIRLQSWEYVHKP